MVLKFVEIIINIGFCMFFDLVVVWGKGDEKVLVVLFE